MALEDSEFGGHGGLIQPPPHPVVGREAAMLERMVAPDDELDSVQAVLADIYAGKYPRVPVAKPAENQPLRPDVMLAATVAQSNGFQFIGVGNWDVRTVRLKASSSPTMHPATYGPEKQVLSSVAPIIDLVIGLEPGHWFYQVVMNTTDITQVWEVDVDA